MLIASNAGYGPIPLRWRTFGLISLLRPQRSSEEEELSRYARGERLIASNAGYGPIPLRWRTFGLISVLRPQGSSGKGMLSRYARGAGMIASRARYGPIPLLSVLPEASNPLPVIAAGLPPKPGSMIPNPPRSRAWMKGSHWPYFQIRKSFPDPFSGQLIGSSIAYILYACGLSKKASSGTPLWRIRRLPST